MLTKLKNFSCKPFPRPIAMIALVTVAILSAIPIMAFLVLVIDWLEPWFSYLFFYLSPRSLLYALPILLSVSYLILLLQNYFSDKRSPFSLLKRVLVVTLIELTFYFWYKVLWEDFIYREFSGGFENLPFGDMLNILQSCMVALSKTTAVICLALIPWLYLKKSQKN